MYFFLPNLSVKSALKDEANHFFSMRLKVGDEVFVTDLQGNLQKIKITLVDKKNHQMAWEIISTNTFSKLSEKILFQAIPDKNYLEKMMEILAFSGFTKIYLFTSDRTPKQQISLERLLKILTRGCELAETTWIPNVEIINTRGKLTQLLSEYTPTVLQQTNSHKMQNTKSIACIVGPEGGWSDKELEFFNQLSLPFYSLGSTIFPSWLAGFVWSQR